MDNIKLTSKKLGFSMLELSIVLLTIAILTASVIQGGALIAKSKIINATNLTKTSPVKKIDGLVLWYETTMPQSLDDASQYNGGLVSTWYNISDTSVTANNATAGTAPSYTTNAINGLPALRFNGSNTYLSYDGTFLANTNYTIFFVQQRRAAQSDAYLSVGTVGGTNQNLHIGYSTNTTAIFNQYSNDLSVTVPGYVSPIPEIDSYWFDSAVGKNFYINGTVKITSTTSNAKTGLVSYVGASIGGRASGGCFNGDISEVIVFNRALSYNERKDIEQYLGKKWGISPIGTN